MHRGIDYLSFEDWVYFFVFDHPAEGQNCHRAGGPSRQSATFLTLCSVPAMFFQAAENGDAGD